MTWLEGIEKDASNLEGPINRLSINGGSAYPLPDLKTKLDKLPAFKNYFKQLTEKVAELEKQNGESKTEVGELKPVAKASSNTGGAASKKHS